MTFDPKGQLFGADNDEPTPSQSPTRGLDQVPLRREEMLWIKQGAHFGWPRDGSFGPFTIRDTGPLWIFDTDLNGVAGIEWAEAVGLPPGVIIGGLGKMVYVPIEDDGASYFVENLPRTILGHVPGFISQVVARPDGTVFATVFGFAANANALIITDLN